MEDTLPKTPNWREQMLGFLVLYIGKQMQETTKSVQQRISEPVIKANHTLKKEDTLFGSILIHNVFILLIKNPLIPIKSLIQSQATKTKNTIIIRFVEQKGNKNEILKLLQEYIKKLQKLQINRDNPALLIIN
jgi:hypothetical protein